MWVIFTLAGLVVLTVLVLSVPLDMVIHLDVSGQPKLRLRLAWLFGLVSKEIKKGKREPEDKRRAVEGRPKRRKRAIGARGILKILRTKGLLRQLKGLIKDFITRIEIRELVADFRIGLGDPAETGLLFALIGPATSFLRPPSRLSLEPSFEDEPVVEGYLHGEIRLVPIRLVAPFIRFALSPATARAIKTLVLTKWKKKK